MPPGVGYPKLGDGSQVVPRGIQPGIPVAGAEQDIPLDLEGLGSPTVPSPPPSGPIDAPSLPPGIEPQLPGVDEGVAPPGGLEPAPIDPATEALVAGIQANDPEAISIIGQLMALVNGSGSPPEEEVLPDNPII